MSVNRLADEGSPYLRQHADNPVDWWPWCDAAFEEARRRDVPVLLSIGYSTCHWCHVMAHECFEDDAVASMMNEAFVNIKVDREERPDIDDVYMAACQAMGKRGGWPLTAILDHDRRPWFLGTYFPKESMGQRPGMMDLVPALAEAWKEQRDKLEAQGAHLLDHLKPGDLGGDVPPASIVRNAVTGLLGREHPEGGFGAAPKFPSLHQVRLLLREGSDDAVAAARRQLDAMAGAGIRDHAGGGLHRYSTDARWHLPHFEKMLYDQGNALWAYAEAYAQTQEPSYREMLDDIADYLERDMRHASGAFFAAEDADSEGEEGLFYTFTWAQLCGAVGKADAKALGGEQGGNFHDEATGKPSRRNIPFTADPEVRRRTREGLMAARAKRERPSRDDKILADWNGLAITGLAAAARATGDERFLRLAQGAADGVWDLLHVDGHLAHAHTSGRTGTPWFLEDQAAMALGLLDLFQAGQRPQDLARALELLGTLDRFGDGALHRTPDDGEALLVRSIDSYDGASPSGNALATHACIHAARITGDLRWEQKARSIVAGLGQSLAKHPLAHTAMLCAIDDLHRDWLDVVVAGPEPEAFLQAIPLRRGTYVIQWDGASDLDAHIEFLPPVGDATVAYVCRGDACEQPITTPEALRQRLA